MRAEHFHHCFTSHSMHPDQIGIVVITTSNVILNESRKNVSLALFTLTLEGQPMNTQTAQPVVLTDEELMTIHGGEVISLGVIPAGVFASSANIGVTGLGTIAAGAGAGALVLAGAGVYGIGRLANFW